MLLNLIMHNTSVSLLFQSVGGTRSVTETSDRGNETTITTTSDKHCQRYV